MIKKLQYLYGIFNFIITYNSTMDEMNKIYYKFWLKVTLLKMKKIIFMMFKNFANWLTQ